MSNPNLTPVNSGSSSRTVETVASLTTQGFGTLGSVLARYINDGETISFFGRFVTGTVAASEARLNLPAGFLPNAAFFASAQIVGEWWINDANGTTRKRGTLCVNPAAASGGYVLFGSDDYTTAAAPGVALNGNSVAGNAQIVYFKIWDLPIEG